jgi:DNA-binding NarL/FixJ family response regulator
LVVDSRPLIRSGLARLAGAALGCESRGCADLAQARAIVNGHRGGGTVVLLGVRGGDDVAASVTAARRGESAVVCVLDTDDAAVIHAALMAGADGYLLLELVDADALRDAVGTVRAGERSIPFELQGSCQGSRVHEPMVTARCLQVLRSLAEGLHDHEIADRLGISTSSVRKHIFTAQERLLARTRTQAVATAARRGFL